MSGLDLTNQIIGVLITLRHEPITIMADVLSGARTRKSSKLPQITLVGKQQS